MINDVYYFDKSGFVFQWITLVYSSLPHPGKGPEFSCMVRFVGCLKPSKQEEHMRRQDAVPSVKWVFLETVKAVLAHVNKCRNDPGLPTIDPKETPRRFFPALKALLKKQ